eukprot:3045113-Pleurochrysis_carterae.AAC.1
MRLALTGRRRGGDALRARLLRHQQRDACRLPAHAVDAPDGDGGRQPHERAPFALVVRLRPERVRCHRREGEEQARGAERAQVAAQRVVGRGGAQHVRLGAARADAGNGPALGDQRDAARRDEARQRHRVGLRGAGADLGAIRAPQSRSTARSRRGLDDVEGGGEGGGGGGGERAEAEQP